MTRRKTVLTYDRAVDRFLAYLQDQRGATRSTIDSYEHVLGYVRDILGADVDPLAIDEDDLLDVIATWRHLAPGTRRHRSSVIRSFFKWLSHREDVANPAARLELPRRRRRARRRLTEDEAQRIADACSTDKELVLVLVLALTGVRIDEFRRIRWRDLDLDERVLRVVEGKGLKGREVPVPVALREALRDVRARLAEHGDLRPSAYICPGPNGGLMGKSNAWHTLHRIARRAGVDEEELGPHDLRRLYATVFLRANPGDLLRLQQLLGHADISTTRLYVTDAEQQSLRAATDHAFGDFVTRRKPLDHSTPETPAPVGEDEP